MKKVEATIEEYGMFANVSKALIGFSSGPDSVCLLDVLHNIYKDTIDFELVYVNHGLRPQRMLRREEAIAKEYAERYRAECKILPVRIKKKGLGVEAAARAARYDALRLHLEKTGAERIVLGHNLDDLVETFLLNLLRGSGTAGLRSIPAHRPPFVRPLLNCKKADILNYLKVRRLRYVIDRSNQSLEYRRNIMRMKVLPVLLKLNPEMHETIRRECQILKYDDEYIWKNAKKVYKKVVKIEKECAVLDINTLMRYNNPVTIRLVMRVIEELCGSLEGYESKHYYAIVSLTDKEHSKKISLPKGLYAQREYESIVIGHASPERTVRKTVDINSSSLSIGDYLLKIGVGKEYGKRKMARNREIFDLSQLSLPLYVRNKKPGDTIETKVGRKKLKKVFSEQRIVPRKRDETLLLCDQKGILWVIGFKRAYRGFVGDKTKNILAVEYEHINKR